MPSPKSGYRALAAGDKKTWLADDHLLRIKTGLFSERYSRLYWADIRAAILYPIEQSGIPLLIAESFSVALVIAGAVLVNPLWGAGAGVLFFVVHALWRFTRPRWAVQLFTKVTAIRLPLAFSRETSRGLVDDMKARILAAQNWPSQDVITSPADRPIISVNVQEKEQPGMKRPRLILYGLLFGFGILSGFTKATVALYCLLFLMIFFVPRDFEFPLTVRSAIVLNQILALFRIVAWFASFRYPLLFVRGWQLQFGNELKLASVVFSLLGLLAVVARSRESTKYIVKSSTTLGLGSWAE
jgi:hypothetical protein